MELEDSKIDIKLDYLLRTKTLIKQALLNKGADVDDNTTFREYADLVNNLVIESDQSDATVQANDMVSGIIAYNDHNKVVGSLVEYSALRSEVDTVVEDTQNDKLIANAKTDVRTLLSSNSDISIGIPYSSITSYQEALDQLADLFGEKKLIRI